MHGHNDLWQRHGSQTKRNDVSGCFPGTAGNEQQEGAHGAKLSGMPFCAHGSWAFLNQLRPDGSGGQVAVADHARSYTDHTSAAWIQAGDAYSRHPGLPA